MTIGIGKTVNPDLITLPLRAPKVNPRQIDEFEWIKYNKQLASVTPRYREGSFTAKFTGMSTPVTGTLEYRIVGYLCAITNPTGSITGTSNATTFTITGAPSFIAPLKAQVCAPIAFEDNGAGLSGRINIPAGGGTWICRSNFLTGAWTNLGTKGLFPQTFWYPLS